jgi:predicted RNA-binding protein associated with RNAse of E/G family
MTSLVVHKLDALGREVRSYPGSVKRRSGSSVTVEAAYDSDEVDLGPFVLRRGDRMLETFYAKRWYNVFTIFDGGTGPRKGWYCNITRPARIHGEHVYAEDLALDVLVDSEGGIHLLDEAEYALLGLSEAEQREVRRARLEIEDRARRGSGPFRRTTR